jgi:lipoprotein NlpI
VTPTGNEDTDCILSELSGKIEHYFLMEQQAKAKAVQCALAQVTFKWLKRIIENAAKGDNVEYLASQLGLLETRDYLNEGLETLWFPDHIVNHAIVLCKQAIANHTFTTAEKRFEKLSRKGGHRD